MTKNEIIPSFPSRLGKRRDDLFFFPPGGRVPFGFLCAVAGCRSAGQDRGKIRSCIMPALITRRRGLSKTEKERHRPVFIAESPFSVQSSARSERPDSELRRLKAETGMSCIQTAHSASLVRRCTTAAAAGGSSHPKQRAAREGILSAGRTCSQEAPRPPFR